MEVALPKGIWQRFHFEDDNPVRHECSSRLPLYSDMLLVIQVSHLLSSPPDFALFCSLLQELPLLFLKGGAIVPIGPVVQHVGEAKPTDTITLLVALDESGKSL